MGMTIDTVDKWLKIQRQNLVDSSESARDKKIESLDTAVSYLEDYQELIRKYQKIQTRLDGLEHNMECLLESDPRTFTDRECENGWLFDKIVEWRKVIKEILEDGNDD